MAKLIHDYGKAKYNTVRFDRLGLENCEILDPRCVDLFPIKKARVHSHEYLEAFYVLKGTGYIHITKMKKIITLREGTMLYIDPKVEHITYVNDKISEATCLNFFVNKLRIAGCKPNSLSSALSGCNDDGYYAIDLNKESILNIVNMINYEHEKQLSGCAYKIGHLFKFLVIDSFRFLPFKSSVVLDTQIDKIPKVMMDIKKFIDENYREEISIEQLANKFFLTPNWLINRFTKTFFVSPIKYLARVRLSKAEELLTNSDLSITEIALEVGYNNSSYFSELFLRYNGKSPSVYRKIRKRL